MIGHARQFNLNYKNKMLEDNTKYQKVKERIKQLDLEKSNKSKSKKK
jgi:hypothetical protein